MNVGGELGRCDLPGETIERVLAAVPDAILLTDPLGVVTFTNPAAEALLALGREAIEGRPLHELLHLPSDPQPDTAADCPSSPLLVEGESRVTVQRIDGSSFDAHASCVPLIEAGRKLGSVVTLRDIGDDLRDALHAAERAREHAARIEAESAARWARFLADASRVLGSTLDPEAILGSVLELAVPSLADFALVDLVEEDGRIRRQVSHHVDPGEEESLRRLETIVPDPAGAGAVAEVLRTRRPMLREQVSLEKDTPALRLLGPLEPRSFISVPLLAAGRILGALSFGTLARSGRRYGPVELSQAEDLAGRAALALANARLAGEQRTQRLRAERSEARFRAIFERGAVGIAIVDPGGIVIEPNPALAELLGYGVDELKGRSFASVTHPEDVGKDRLLYDELLQGKRMAYQLDKRYVRKDGRVIWGRLLVTLLPSAEPDEPLGLGMVVDVTEAKQAQENAKRLALEEASRAQAEEAHARVAEILENIPDGFVAFDRGLAIRYVNAKAESLLGLRSAELVGRGLQDLAGGELLADDRFGPALVKARDGTASSWLVRLEARGVWIEIHAFPAASGPSVFLRDVTSRHETEEAQRRLAAILEATPDFVASADPLGRLVYANAAARALADLDRLQGESLASVVGPASARVLLDSAIPEALRTGLWRGETALRSGDGDERFVSQVLLAHRDEEGRLLGLSTLARDVTQQKRVEAGQRFLIEASRLLASQLESRATLHRLVELAVPHLADFCLVVTPVDGQLVQIAEAHTDSERVSELVALNGNRHPDAAVGAPAVIRTGEAELVPEVTEPWLWEATRDPQVFQAARRVGARSLVIAPLLAHGRKLGSISFGTLERPLTSEDLARCQDFAARAALAMDNARLYEEAVQATRLREEVMGVVSHDLRNPLTAVVLAARNLQRLLASPEQAAARSQAEKILRSTERAVRLIADLLDVARLEAGGVTIDAVPVPAGALATEAVELHRELAEATGVKLELQLDEPLPELRAERDKMLQVFSNLIGNAIKFTQAGGTIVVHARRVGDAVEFEVADTGEGIRPEDLPHVWDRFWQATRRKESAGLGLAIVRGIVQAHGGSVDVRSEPAVGTTFTFRIPIWQEASGSGRE